MSQIITTNTSDAQVKRHIEAIAEATGSALKGMSIAILIEETKNQMRHGVCHFIFRKTNGEMREAFGTLDANVVKATVKGTGNSPENWGACYYHDVIKGAPRSFKWENLVAVLS